MDDSQPPEMIQHIREQVHSVWFEGKLYFNVVHFLAYYRLGGNDPWNYWSVLKRRLNSEGFQATKEHITQFTIKTAQDRRTRKQDYATRETFLRLIQSISSEKVEGIKLDLARLGEEHFQELEAQDIADELEASRQKYRELGRSEDWIDRRIENIAARNGLTDEWKRRGPLDYAKYAEFTSILHKGALGVTPAQHKAIKGLKNHNIRDHMIPVELALSTLAEVTATTKHQMNNSSGERELEQDVLATAAGSEEIRKITEHSLGGPVVSSQNFLPPSKDKKKKGLSPAQPTPTQKRSPASGPSQPSLLEE